MLSDTLRFLRMTQNLKQKIIADLLGMSQPNYSNLENGKTKLNGAAAEKLAGYYGVSKDVFLKDKQSLINHTILQHDRSINNTGQYFETNKELLEPILERMEILLNILADEKEELAMERRQLSEVFDKLAIKFDNRL
ncbi:MAG: helix-turn-helix transcriptional regulator [Ferruginibacter sp.]